MEPSAQQPRHTTGIAHHATTAALTTSRSLTSHLRRRYHERYKGKYQRYRLVFAFDMFLVGFAAALLIAVVALTFQGFQTATPGIDVAFEAATVRSSDVTPVEVRVRVTDAVSHSGVSVIWKKPAWVDVVSAEPKISKSGEIFFGELKAGEEKDAHLVLRIKALPGTALGIGVTVRQDGFLGFARYADVAMEPWLVRASALHVELPGSVGGVVSGGSVPLVVSNESSATTSLATLRLTARDGAPNAVINSGDTFVTLSDLPPRSKQVAYMDIGSVNATSVHLAWELQDAAQAVSAGDRIIPVVSSTDVRVTQPLSWIRGAESVAISYENGSSPARIFIDHPLLSDATSTEPYRFYALAPQGGVVHIPLDAHRETSATRWSAIPVMDAPSGAIFGVRSIGSISATLAFASEARYYASTGDQIGIGPLPPTVGQTTSYWIVWMIGPTQTDLTNVVMNAPVPPHVHATGRFASDTGGTFTSNASAVTWSVPVLSATRGSVVAFAFEVALDPTSEIRGTLPLLLGKSSVHATDVQTNESVAATAPAVTTSMTTDAKSPNDGVVR